MQPGWFLCIYIVCGYVCNTVAELSLCNKNWPEVFVYCRPVFVAQTQLESKNIYFQALYRSLRTPGLEQRLALSAKPFCPLACDCHDQPPGGAVAPERKRKVVRSPSASSFPLPVDSVLRNGRQPQRKNPIFIR